MAPPEARDAAQPDAPVLTGTRAQTAVTGCPAASRVGELVFAPEGFSVTFAPFESYRDYWGAYQFDPATGALHMTVKAGNRVPSGLDLDGTARIEDGHLILESMFLGDSSGNGPDGDCRYVF